MEFSFEGRINRNVLICGSSGVGKTVFLEAAREYYPSSAISFLAAKDRSVGVLVSEYRPFARFGVRAWVDAFLAVLPDPNGWFSSQVPAVLWDVFGACKYKEESDKLTVQYFLGVLDARRQLASKAIQPVYYFVESQVKMLYPDRFTARDSEQFYEGSGGRFFFDGLSDWEKRFFHEFILRLYWNRNHSLFLRIDEFHHLSDLQHSIIGVILREVRSRGGVVAATQNLSDVYPSYVNQFGSLFLGSTISPDDLGFWRYSSPLVSQRLASMPPYRFFDARAFLRNPGLSVEWEAVIQ